MSDPSTGAPAVHDPAPETVSPESSVPERPERLRGVAASIWALEHAQDVLAIIVGIMLVLLAGTLIVSGVAGFVVSAQHTSVTTAATSLIDRILLVLILVEVVHTVVLSLRAHRLAAQPFIVIGLVAVIRRILLILSNQQKVDPVELGLLIAMVVAFVAGLISVRLVERRVELSRRRRPGSGNKPGSRYG